jgi:hypothetical protein
VKAERIAKVWWQAEQVIAMIVCLQVKMNVQKVCSEPWVALFGHLWRSNKKNALARTIAATSKSLYTEICQLFNPMATCSRTCLAAKQSSGDNIPAPEIPQTPAPIESSAKQKRSKTTDASATPSAKQPATKNPLPSAAVQNTSVDSLTTEEHFSASRSYETRPSNNPHPAKSLGLQKRTQADVKAIAAAKRVAKQQKADAKDQEELDKSKQKARGLKAVAALLDERKQQEGLNDAASLHPILFSGKCNPTYMPSELLPTG